MYRSRCIIHSYSITSINIQYICDIILFVITYITGVLFQVIRLDTTRQVITKISVKELFYSPNRAQTEYVIGNNHYITLVNCFMDYRYFEEKTQDIIIAIIIIIIIIIINCTFASQTMS